MNDNHTTSVASLGINTHFSNSSVSSGGSPLNSPLMSPAPGSPFPPENSSWDQLQNQFTQQMSLQPPSPAPPVTTKSGSGNTFVHKLYNMVVDKQYQHLIAWTYTGTSFIVCNITEFSRDVLPKHFKHNNFSSFVRQLNMYGFHKVNKSPRGHRTLAENQIWEFSHPKFLRNRPDLLDEIKRKALENESVRRDTSDINSHMTMMQMSQTDMLQQISQLQENLNQVVHELTETKRRQLLQQQTIKDMMDFMTKQYGSCPTQNNTEVFDNFEIKQDPDRPPPPIFITSADQHHHQQQQHQQGFYLNINEQSNSNNNNNNTSPSNNNNPQPLSVQTQINMNQYQPRSPSYQNAMNTPLPPSPCPRYRLNQIPSNAFLPMRRNHKHVMQRVRMLNYNTR
ncbi:hypothetical protein MFLAVUS_003650 [Mucor flavus]|uniref:HSF-type DNA-binding domain-containing protein n=1 Tax=Mucor flavus TaxID=439312 RepID=A0ABP9YTT2_9FUNG